MMGPVQARRCGENHFDRIVRNATIEDIDRALRGRAFATPERVGKWLIARAAGPAVLLHFGMTGDILWERDNHPDDAR